MFDPSISQNNPIDPSRATSPHFSSLHSHSKQSNSSVFKNEAEQLYAYITYVTNAPEKQKKSFEYLTIMMYLGGSCLLSNKEEELALREISNLKEDLYGGVVSYADPHFEDHLLQIIQKITDNNPRAKLLSQAMELEFLLVLHAPNGIYPLDDKECDRVLNPLRAKVYDASFSSLHLVNLSKNIAGIKEKLLKFPNERNHHLNLLEDLFRSF